MTDHCPRCYAALIQIGPTTAICQACDGHAINLGCDTVYA